MNNQIYYKQKNKNVFLRISKKDKAHIIHYKAYDTSVIVEGKQKEELSKIIDITFKQIDNYIKANHTKIPNKKEIALEWLIKELFKLKQPTLF